MKRKGQPQSGMKAGYKYGESKCPECGEEIADNWYIRHMNKCHPLLQAGPEK